MLTASVGVAAALFLGLWVWAERRNAIKGNRIVALEAQIKVANARAKIASRPDSSPADLIDRMRSGN